MIKILQKLGTEGTYLNIIKAGWVMLMLHNTFQENKGNNSSLKRDM